MVITLGRSILFMAAAIGFAAFVCFTIGEKRLEALEDKNADLLFVIGAAAIGYALIKAYLPKVYEATGLERPSLEGRGTNWKLWLWSPLLLAMLSFIGWTIYCQTQYGFWMGIYVSVGCIVSFVQGFIRGGPSA